MLAERNYTIPSLLANVSYMKRFATIGATQRHPTREGKAEENCKENGFAHRFVSQSVSSLTSSDFRQPAPLAKPADCVFRLSPVRHGLIDMPPHPIPSRQRKLISPHFAIVSTVRHTHTHTVARIKVGSPFNRSVGTQSCTYGCTFDYSSVC